MKPKTVSEKKLKKTERASEEKSHVLEVSGLCVTCALAETCSYRKTAKGPIHFCEEFDDSGEHVQTKFRKVTPQITPSSKESAFDLRGLCVNCEHRATCEHARTEGGVWHCENYE